MVHQPALRFLDVLNVHVCGGEGPGVSHASSEGANITEETLPSSEMPCNHSSFTSLTSALPTSALCCPCHCPYQCPFTCHLPMCTSASALNLRQGQRTWAALLHPCLLYLPCLSPTVCPYPCACVVVSA